MSGTHITDRQVHLYMTKRKDHTQEVAAAKAGMSVHTARRLTKATELPSQKPERFAGGLHRQVFCKRLIFGQPSVFKVFGIGEKCMRLGQ